jgi:hypothetical protein
MTMRPTRYLWFKYSLAVILLSLLVFLVVLYRLTVGPGLLVLLTARTLVEPVQMHWLTKKGKFNDLIYITKRNKLNVIVGIIVVFCIIAAYPVLIYHLFWVGSLTLDVLFILATFVAVDVGWDFLMYYQLRRGLASV